MKAHRREAKNTALIECVQVAAEKAKWRIRDDFKRMSSLKDGGGARAAVPATPREPVHAGRPAAQPQRTVYDRAPPSPPEPIRPPPPPPQARAAPAHGAMRFSSVFGGRRR
jgi:hypothetical protein